MTTIHGCLLQLDLTGLIVSDLTVLEVTDTIYAYFKYCSDVNSDGLYCLAGLANNIKHKFKDVMITAKDYISYALKKTSDSDTFKGALFCIADIARAMDKEFADYLPIVDFLLL